VRSRSLRRKTLAQREKTRKKRLGDTGGRGRGRGRGERERKGKDPFSMSRFFEEAKEPGGT